MKIQIKVGEKRKMVNTRFKIFVCGSATPCSCWSAPEWVKGKMVEDALTMKNTDTAKELCLLPVKLHYSTLAREAIKAALADYELKQKEEDKKKQALGEASCRSHGVLPTPTLQSLARRCSEALTLKPEMRGLDSTLCSH